MVNRQRDLIIIGAGPAGVGCALELLRHDIDLMLMDFAPVGGNLPCARRIDNLPGFPGGIGGEALARRLATQVRAGQLPFVPRRATTLRPVTVGWHVTTEDGREFASRAVLVASGGKPLSFAVDGWRQAQACGRGHRDVRRLPRRLAGQQVAVIGSGEAALDSALTAHDRGAHTAVALRGETLKTHPFLQREVAATSVAIHRRWLLRHIAVDDAGLTLCWRTPTGNQSTRADHLLVCIGREPRRELLGAMTPGGSVVAERHVQRGLFLAGDCRFGRHAGVAAAMGDGQHAASTILGFLFSSKSF